MSRKRRPADVPSDFSVNHEGNKIGFSKYIHRTSARVNFIVVEPLQFSTCPICLDAYPTVPEHMPPQSLGGTVLTDTCQSCNNDFGTAEEELRRFLDLEVKVHAQSTSGQIPG